MNSAGRILGTGGYRAFTCKIRPFAARLDVELDFLFYSVPVENPRGPTTVFTDRFWDWCHGDHWLPDSVGVVPNTFKPYFGAIPGPDVGALEGTPDQWINGFDYDTWIAGGYVGASCWPIHPATKRIHVKQAERLHLYYPRHIVAWQEQSLTVSRALPLALSEAQILVLTNPVSPIVVRQEQAFAWVGTVPYVDRRIQQGQRIDAFAALEINAKQGQRIDAFAALEIEAKQGQRIDLFEADQVELRQGQSIDLFATPQQELQQAQSIDLFA